MIKRYEIIRKVYFRIVTVPKYIVNDIILRIVINSFSIKMNKMSALNFKWITNNHIYIFNKNPTSSKNDFLYEYSRFIYYNYLLLSRTIRNKSMTSVIGTKKQLLLSSMWSMVI